MNGFRIDCDSQAFPGPIELAISPLLSKHWLVCTQGGPFSITDKPNFEELAAETSFILLDVPEFRNTDAHLFQQGVFPRFSKFLVVNEWTYLVALDGPAELAKQNAVKIKRAGDWLSRTFFEAIETTALGFFMYVDGFWEIYLRDQSSQAKLTAEGLTEIHSDHWIRNRESRS